MPRFLIDLDGADAGPEEVNLANVDAARDAAIVRLGKYLQVHPEFALNRYWRVDVKEPGGRLLLHVIVATVAAPPAINFASFD